MIELIINYMKGINMAKETKIGSKVFKTKAELKKYLQEQMYKVQKDVPLQGVHLKVTDYVFRQHENYEEKTKGLDYEIAVRTSSGMNKKFREYYIIREDGTSTDFSYIKAVTGKSSKITDIKQALRALILDQHLEEKNKYFENKADGKGYIVCESTGLKIKKNECHIDHYPVKFETIVANWFNERNLSSESFELEDGGDNTMHMLVADKSLAEDFYNYHKENAKYRFVLAKANLQASQGSRKVF